MSALRVSVTNSNIEIYRGKGDDPLLDESVTLTVLAA